ncbi:hypothetical protein ARSEF1564_008011 [Beauveria bassiana]
MPFSSPSPSGGGDSSISSPDTRLTAPSPNDAIKRDVSSIRSNSDIEDNGLHRDKQMVHRRPNEQREQRPVTPQEVNGWLQNLEKGSRVFHGARRIIERNGIVGIFFEDIRDAWLFQNQTSSSNFDWQVTHDASADLYPLPRDSGQLVVLATVPPGSTNSEEQVVTEVMTDLRAHGEIFAFEKKMTYRDGSFRGIVEYCDVVAAKTALTQAPTSEGQSGIRIVIAAYQEEESMPTGGARNCDTIRISNPNASWEYGLVSSKQNSIPQTNLCLNTSLAMYPIMLRNIPNKVDQAMLKRIVDESSWGKYDFMYLRIDFANDCNVGYAFINFVDLYFTSNGPMPEMAGQEEQFPEPDNQSKMKRSCENAEHVGLFTPNAGQHFRDEQRRRRSQYDRGTRLAALEEYDLEAIQHLYIGSERPG